MSKQMTKQTKITNFFIKSTNVCINEMKINSSVGQTVKTKSNADLNESRKSVKKLKFETNFETKDNKTGFETNCRTNDKRFNRKSKTGNTGRKVCPFYKKIPSTAFAVDAFNFGSIPGISVYFLTHFHSDHYYGLNNSFNDRIYCSPITSSLVRNHFQKGLFELKVIEINETQEVMGTKVTFFDANHCPGAVVILFELSNGLRYLHTGDFRADQSFFSYRQLICRPIDTIFLDTTYCDPKYDFLPQKQVLETIVSISADYYKKYPKLLIICGTYTIGKENVFISIAKALKLKVWTNPNKRQIYKCYKSSEIESMFESNKQNSRLHVLPMNDINETFLRKYLQEFNGLYDEVLAFRPTGWEHNKKSLNGYKARHYKNITIYGIEYSEHSSFPELQRFVSFFKPNKIIATVNNTNELMRNKMNYYFNQWINTSDDSSDIKEIPQKPKINGSVSNWIQKQRIETNEEIPDNSVVFCNQK